ncbi:helix-turn-helix domain-containing protein [Nocardia sp. CA-119907]|uniref:helix-turn-helix domain-containing protein n=1 Tax=Nocardia sp. CA-119907 TaxID=3239973 RepID=UPI003D9525A4
MLIRRARCSLVCTESISARRKDSAHRLVRAAVGTAEGWDMVIGGRFCRACRAAIPGNEAGGLCVSCAHAAGFKRLLPADFFDNPAIRKPLADHDFGVVFAMIREQTGLSQLQLGALIDLSQSRVSAVERGDRRLTSAKLIARISETLGIPGSLLGFYGGSPSNLASEEVTWVERRDFITLVTAAALGSHLHPELERLGGLLPGRLEPVTQPHIGSADIDAIEAITDGFRRWDLAHGGGLCRTAALTQLHQVRALEGAVCSSDIRTRLWIATAELASMAGWLAYDIEEHDSARKLWTYALQTAHRGEDHARSTDLTVSILLDMAHQSLHLRRPQEALKFTQLASSAAINRKHPVSTIISGYIAAVLGWCWASLNEAAATERAIGQSEDQYASANPDRTPPWAWFVTPAEIAAQQGHSMYLLSLTQPRYASAAIGRLSIAVSGHAMEHARSRAVALPTLAGACLQAGDFGAAARYGRDAITAITELSSQRCYIRLRDLDSIAAGYDSDHDVADLRSNIGAVLTSAV